MDLSCRLLVRIFFCAAPANGFAAIILMISGFYVAIVVWLAVFSGAWKFTSPRPERGEPDITNANNERQL